MDASQDVQTPLLGERPRHGSGRHFCKPKWMALSIGETDVPSSLRTDGELHILYAVWQRHEMLGREVNRERRAYARIAHRPAVDEDLVRVFREPDNQPHGRATGRKAQVQAVPDKPDRRAASDTTGHELSSKTGCAHAGSSPDFIRQPSLMFTQPFGLCGDLLD